MEAARALVGTPFRHQGRAPGLGLDCAGVIAAVAIPLGLASPTMDRIDYSHLPDPEDLLSCLLQFCADAGFYEDGKPVAGSVVTLKVAGLAVHCGWSTGTGLVHAYSPSGKVVEHPWRRWLPRIDRVLTPRGLLG